jgi:RecA-family ATPase
MDAQLENSVANSAPDAPYVEPLRFVTLNEYCDLRADPQKWIVKKLIPVGGMINLYAKPKVGKSFLMLAIIEAIIEGRPTWDGFEINKHGPVMYLQIDTPREEWKDRVVQMRERLADKGCGDLFHIADMWNIPNFPFNILNPDNTELVWLKNEVDRIKPILVVIDTMREVHSGDENDNTVMRNVISSLIKACRGESGAPTAIALVSHQRKDGIQAQEGSDDMMDQNRGASYVSGKMDMIWRLTRKRLTYKGRAVGLEHVDIEQDPVTNLIRVKNVGPNEDQQNVGKVIEQLSDQFPGISKNELADKLGAKFNFSRSTGIRKIDEWVAVSKQGVARQGAK